MLLQCWLPVCDIRPASTQHWVNDQTRRNRRRACRQGHWPNAGLMLGHPHRWTSLHQLWKLLATNLGPESANTTSRPKAGLKLAEHLRRCANISPALGQRVVFAGDFFKIIGLYFMSHRFSNLKNWCFNDKRQWFALRRKESADSGLTTKNSEYANNNLRHFLHSQNAKEILHTYFLGMRRQPWTFREVLMVCQKLGYLTYKSWDKAIGFNSSCTISRQLRIAKCIYFSCVQKTMTF